MLLFVLRNFQHDRLTPAQRDRKPALAKRHRITSEDFGPPAMQGGNSLCFSARQPFQIAKIGDEPRRDPKFCGPKPKKRSEQVERGRRGFATIARLGG